MLQQLLRGLELSLHFSANWLCDEYVSSLLQHTYTLKWTASVFSLVICSFPSFPLHIALLLLFMLTAPHVSSKPFSHWDSTLSSLFFIHMLSKHFASLSRTSLSWTPPKTLCATWAQGAHSDVLSRRLLKKCLVLEGLPLPGRSETCGQVWTYFHLPARFSQKLSYPLHFNACTTLKKQTGLTLLLLCFLISILLSLIFPNFVSKYKLWWNVDWMKQN